MQVDGVVHSLTQPPTLRKQEKHTIDVVVDRLTVQPSSKRRLTDSVETALGLGSGWSPSTSSTSPRTIRIASGSSPSTSPACTTTCPSRLEPRSFSFNSPFGACQVPSVSPGRGRPGWSFPDPTRSLADGAVAPWSARQTSEYFTSLSSRCPRRSGSGWTRHGSGCRRAPGGGPARVRRPGARALRQPVRNAGARTPSSRASSRSSSDAARRRATPAGNGSGYMRGAVSGLQGARLKPVSLAVTLGGRSVRHRRDADRRVRAFPAHPRPEPARASDRRARTQGGQRACRSSSTLGWTTPLSRPAAAACRWEAQRIRLAADRLGTRRRAVRPR